MEWITVAHSGRSTEVPATLVYREPQQRLDSAEPTPQAPCASSPGSPYPPTSAVRPRPPHPSMPWLLSTIPFIHLKPSTTTTAKPRQYPLRTRLGCRTPCCSW